jgi:hypothetical protein
MKQNLTRRDLCDLVGQRAARLSDRQSINAWRELAREIERLGDVAGPARTPKFRDLLAAIRLATIKGVKRP